MFIPYLIIFLILFTMLMGIYTIYDRALNRNLNDFYLQNITIAFVWSIILIILFYFTV